jgi:predicted nucleotidyltransferase
MSRDEVIAKLRQHAPELQAEGILHLALFGSTARDEADDKSDIDLAAEYDEAKRLTLLDISGLHLKLEDLFGVKVDLCDRRRLKPILRPYIEKDLVDAF